MATTTNSVDTGLQEKNFSIKNRATRPMNVTKRKTAERTKVGNRGIKPAEEFNPEEDLRKGKELSNHLISISPFNKRWEVTEIINQGAFGAVFAVKDIKTGTKGAIKVAKADLHKSVNQTTEWEGFVLEKVFKNNPDASVVRLLDRGMLVDHTQQGMEFVVLEKADIDIRVYVDEVSGKERNLRVSYVALQSLKGLTDLHMQGFLHRDFKPDNMGILSRENPIVVIFDLGMARIFTEADGKVRPPRTTVNFRGTVEYASGHAIKSRDQTRFDDLISWFYSIIELFDPNIKGEGHERPFPWTGVKNTNAIHFLKSPYAPAHLLLRNCPKSFFTINMYLMSANHSKAPNYEFIADCVMEAIAQYS